MSKEAEKIVETIRNSNISEWDARSIIGALHKEGLIRADYIIWDSDVRDAARRAVSDADVSDEDIPGMVEMVMEQMSQPDAYIEMYSGSIEDAMRKEAEFLVGWNAEHGHEDGRPGHKKEKTKAEQPSKRTQERRKGAERER